MVHALVAVVLSGILGVVPAFRSPGRTRAVPVTMARVSVQVTTTSSKATVGFYPATVLTARVLSRTGGLTVERLPSGWVLTNPSPGQTATVGIDAVVEETSRAPIITTSIEKAIDGATSVRVVNTSRQPFEIVAFTNAAHLAGLEVQVMRMARARARFFGTRNVAPRAAADGRRLVLSFYYPWWEPGSYGSPTLAERPEDMLYTSVAEDVDAMTVQARSRGVDGFVVSWHGEAATGSSLDLALDAAERRGGVVSAYIEMEGANQAGEAGAPPDALTAGRWLNQALGHASSPAFLRSGGVPVVFVYKMSLLPPAAWRQILDALRSLGREVLLVGDAPMDRYAGVSWGFHQYNPSFLPGPDLRAWNRGAAADLRILSPTTHLFAATVSPGYDDRNLRREAGELVPRGASGERYAVTWQAARSATPDWVLITSWNEWYEGTNIQPGVSTGDLALRQTAAEAAAFKRVSSRR